MFLLLVNMLLVLNYILCANGLVKKQVCQATPIKARSDLRNLHAFMQKGRSI